MRSTSSAACRRRRCPTISRPASPGRRATSPASIAAYQDLADHYGFVVLPARVRKPRDKAKVEVAVQIVCRYVLGRLRNRRFFSLDELNAAVRDCVTAINAKVMQRLGKSRNELFATLDRPALKPLPAERYQYAEWKRCTVAPDYHVEVDGHYYSVPYRLLRESVDVRFTAATVEVLHKGRRVASHVRSHLEHKHTTTPRAHAVEPPPLRRVVAGPHAARGGQDRPGDDGAHRGDHEGQAAPGAGLPLVPRHPEPAQELRPGTHRGGSSARQRHRRHAPTARSSRSCRTVSTGPTARPSRRRPRRSSTPTSAAVATTTEPPPRVRARARTRRQRDECSAGGTREEGRMLTHPTYDRLVALGLTGMAKALDEQRGQRNVEGLTFEERLGLLVDREAAERESKRLVTRLKYATSSRSGRSRTSTPERARRCSLDPALAQARHR